MLFFYCIKNLPTNFIFTCIEYVIVGRSHYFIYTAEFSGFHVTFRSGIGYDTLKQLMHLFIINIGATCNDRLHKLKPESRCGK